MKTSIFMKFIFFTLFHHIYATGKPKHKNKNYTVIDSLTILGLPYLEAAHALIIDTNKNELCFSLEFYITEYKNNSFDNNRKLYINSNLKERFDGLNKLAQDCKVKIIHSNNLFGNHLWGNETCIPNKIGYGIQLARLISTSNKLICDSYCLG